MLTAGHDAVYAEHRNSVLDAFAPTTGDILWRAALPDTAAVSHGARVCGDGMVYATGSEKLYAFSA